ncbi:MAG: cation:proton antiporter [Nitrosarchaeum sp.]|nr:cation:proton antiporter [Nitrosarchaeum sp.]
MQIEHLLLTLVLSLAVARILGELFRRMKQPSLVGELLAGVILGPSLLAILSPDDSMTILANVAVFFLIFMAGLELNLSEIRKSTKPAFLLAIVGFTIPFVSGYYTSLFFGLGQIQSLFVGLLLSITAIPVSSMILMEFGILKSKIGTTVITAALINDIMAMIVFSLILIYPTGTQTSFDYYEVGLMGAKITIFFAVLAAVVFVMKKTNITSQRVEPLVEKLKTKEASVGILLSLGISIALFAHYFNLHFIIGAFFAGLIFGSKFWGEKIHNHNSKLISGITFGFFAPLFFVFIGLEFDLMSLTNSAPLFLALFFVAVASKIVGGFLAARITRFSNHESVAIGCLMNGRGMVEMAIASIGYSLGLIDTTLFSVVIAIGFLTTIITPVIAKPFIYKTISKRVQDSEIKQMSESKRNFLSHHITYRKFHDLIDKTYFEKFLGHKTN